MVAEHGNGLGDGFHIGDLLQAYVQYAPLPFLVTHAYFDYFVPGNYYTRAADDAWFLRFEMMFLF
jgi:hypothetical protein